jgi:hypothetical protein
VITDDLTANLLALNDESRDSTGKCQFFSASERPPSCRGQRLLLHSDKFYGHAPGDLDYLQRSAGAASGFEKEKKQKKQNK